MFKWLCMRSLKEHWAQSSENKPARMSDAELTNTPADAGIPVRSATAERTRAHRERRRPPAEPVARSSAARRMRNHQKRRRSGLRCFTVQVFEKEIDTLIRKGLLEPDARHNRYAVREALHKLLARTLGPTPGWVTSESSYARPCTAISMPRRMPDRDR
jgi:hypothetical protein